MSHITGGRGEGRGIEGGERREGQRAREKRGVLRTILSYTHDAMWSGLKSDKQRCPHFQ